MEEQRVSLETAKILLEKNITFYNCYNYYEVLEDSFGYDGHKGDEFLMYKKGQILLSKEPPYNTKYKKIGIAPTQSLVQKYIREESKLHITIFSSSQESWMFRITKPNQKLEEGTYGEDFDSYEAALEAGLQEILNVI